ncbi:MAG: histidine--tRNA ligase [Ruminococcaceae bacterium]|nr:histidine--tRNA ligase [Oscillospiraceae bacterium]
MALLTKAPRGTQDTLPSESFRLRRIEEILAETAMTFGFREIRTPVFEHTELFCRGMGDTTDVVQKEMYTFNDNGNRSISLRPEGTAGTVRAFLEHGLYNEPLPQKYFYLTSCYRYEKPQAGRLREFHQFGIESLGTASPAADAEIIALARHIFDFFELDGISLEINSIGCPHCRKNYHAALLSYFESKKGELCETCLSRLERNPMRILDCKSPVCSAIAKDAPVVLDFLCEECDTHFRKVQKYLDAMDMDYTVNPRIVRGLDYYTKTVFEFVSSSIGAQGTICGGGRYDGLIKELGGNELPACGFGMGMERLIMLLDAQRKGNMEAERPDIYIAPASPDYSFEAMRLVNDLRYEGFSALTDLCERSLKAQMKYANKKNARFTLVLGEDEIKNRKAAVKNMDNGESTELSLDKFTNEFMHLSINAALGMDDSILNNLTLLDGGKQ